VFRAVSRGVQVPLVGTVALPLTKSLEWNIQVRA
jgi:hypothetical protein